MREKGVPPVIGSRIHELPRRDGEGKRPKKREKRTRDERDDRVSISRDARLLSLMEEAGEENPTTPEK